MNATYLNYINHHNYTSQDRKVYDYIAERGYMLQPDKEDHNHYSIVTNDGDYVDVAGYYNYAGRYIMLVRILMMQEKWDIINLAREEFGKSRLKLKISPTEHGNFVAVFKNGSISNAPKDSSLCKYMKALCLTDRIEPSVE
jgi:hypothetical protein